MKMQNSKFIILIFCVIIFFANVGHCGPYSQSYPIATNGVLDLTNWNFEESGITNLNGEWDFYWMQLLTPEDLKIDDSTKRTGLIQLPRFWNNYNVQGERLSANGYATFRLIMKFDNKHEMLAIKIPKIATAYNVWIDDRLVASAGKVGRNEFEMKPAYLPQVIVFKPGQDTTQIVFQVSNFMFKDGGMWNNLQIGTEKQITIEREKKVAFDMFLFGSLFIMAMYHLILFIYRRQEYVNLYYGLFCMLISIRGLFLGETFVMNLLPNIRWELAQQIEFLTYYLGQPLYVMVFYSLFPLDVSKKYCKICAVVGGIFGLMVLLTPANVYTNYLYVYQIISMIAIVFWFYYVILVVVRKRDGAPVTIVGGVILVTAVISDLLYYNDIRFINNFFKTDHLSSIGLLIFIFSQSCNLSRRFSLAFVKIEEMSNEMMGLNENLEAIVKERTVALQQASNQVKMQKTKLEEANRILRQLSAVDGLTDIANRRRFDEVIAFELKHSLSNHVPLSIIFIDIDYFKDYNDHYGHPAGDECLIAIAKVLKESITYEKDLVARYGGEEFVAVLSNTDDDNAYVLAEKIRIKVEALHIPHDYSSVSKYVTISVGVATVLSNRSICVKELLQEADIALYEAKNAGRNIVISSNNIKRPKLACSKQK